MKKKSIKKKSKNESRMISLHVYGIFDKKKKSVIKVSLDHSDIDMEMALLGEMGEKITECEFDIKLVI